MENSSQAQLQITSRPAFTYAFALIPGPNTTARTVCQIVNQTSPSDHTVYWYSGSTALAGQYANASPNQFHESRNVTGVKGLEFLGTFTGGTVSGGTAAYETVYFTERRCTDAGREFGFFKDLVAGDRIVFYYSDFSNCDGLCRVTDSPNGQLRSVLTSGVSISNLSSGAHYFRAYMTSDTNFRVEVLETDHTTLSQCSFNGGSTGSCQTNVAIETWFHANSASGMSGYVVSGIQSVGFNHVPNDPTFYVEVANVGQ